jgi:hypothetical protein
LKVEHYNIVLSSFMTYHRVCNKSNTMVCHMWSRNCLPCPSTWVHPLFLVREILYIISNIFAKPQVFYYLVSDAKIFDIIYQLSPLLECDPTVCLSLEKFSLGYEYIISSNDFIYCILKEHIPTPFVYFLKHFNNNSMG